MAATGKLVLFGIKPGEPHTGYGYIRKGKPLAAGAGAFLVDAFFEKPQRATAEEYVAAQTYFWNSGIFVLNARVFLEELEAFAPEIGPAATAALANAEDDLGFTRRLADRVVFLGEGNIAEEGTATQVLDRPASEQAQKYLRLF